MTYMNYIDENIKSLEENKTVGIIICKKDNKFVIRYCSDNRIIAREYVLVWSNNINVKYKYFTWLSYLFNVKISM